MGDQRNNGEQNERKIETKMFLNSPNNVALKIDWMQ